MDSHLLSLQENEPVVSRETLLQEPDLHINNRHVKTYDVWILVFNLRVECTIGNNFLKF